MQVFSKMQASLLSMIALAALSLAGCGGTKSPEASKQNATTEASSAIAANWCVEHGVPEDICALCNAKVAADFKQKGDWCKEHNRPESQCFLCNPQLEAKFAAEYETKYGKKPGE